MKKRDRSNPLWFTLEHRGQRWEFMLPPEDERAIVLGSGPGADIRIKAPRVAPLALHFEREADGVLIVPLSPKVRVNARPVMARFRIKGVALIELADVELRVRVASQRLPSDESTRFDRYDAGAAGASDEATWALAEPTLAPAAAADAELPPVSELANEITRPPRPAVRVRQLWQRVKRRPRQMLLGALAAGVLIALFTWNVTGAFATGSQGVSTESPALSAAGGARQGDLAAPTADLPLAVDPSRHPAEALENGGDRANEVSLAAHDSEVPAAELAIALRHLTAGRHAEARAAYRVLSERHAGHPQAGSLGLISELLARRADPRCRGEPSVAFSCPEIRR